jgi:CDP-diacylglycerol pyrophosphatase
MKRRPWIVLGGAIASLAVFAVGLLFGPDILNAADPDALWKIVHGACVPHQELALDPSPCAYVSKGSEREPGYVVLKDRTGATQYLVIPTDKVTGIEDPKLLGQGTESYLVKAWAFRSLLFARLGHDLPSTDMSLAINSVYGRSQNQLHIHVDCLRADIRDALQKAQPTIGPELRPIDLSIPGRAYQAMAIAAPDLERINLFHRLAGAVPAGTMGSETLVVVGAKLANGQPGFDVLVDRADMARGDAASGEELQDHDCAVKTDTAPAG